MNSHLKIFIRNVKNYGIKGVPNFLKNRLRKIKFNVYILLNAILYPRHEHAFGVTIVARLRDQQALSKTMRDLILALKEAGVPYQTLDLSPKSEIPQQSYANLLTPRNKFRIHKYDCVIQMLEDHIPRIIKIKRALIVFWEYDSGILESLPSLTNADIIIGMSDFNVAYYKRVFLTKKVCKILYPLQIKHSTSSDAAATRTRLGIKADDFVVFYNFGLAMERKNPEGCIKAFAEAFRNDTHAKLLLKTSYSEKFSSYLNAIQELLEKEGISQQTIVLREYVSDQEIFDITNSTDVYMSLHRGEGFGIGMAEAMSLGKPVIATDYSASTEFCRDENSIPVPYVLTKCAFDGPEKNAYFGVTKWADPDIHFAANALKKCKDDVQYRERIGCAGKHFISQYFSTENFKKSISCFVNDLCSP